MPFMNFLDAGKFVQSIKYGCELNGLAAGPPRAPLQALDGEEKARFQAIVAETPAHRSPASSRHEISVPHLDRPASPSAPQPSQPDHTR